MFRDALATEITGAFRTLRHGLARRMVKTALLNQIWSRSWHDVTTQVIRFTIGMSLFCVQMELIIVRIIPSFVVIPAKAGIHPPLGRKEGNWIPAFAGMT